MTTANPAYPESVLDLFRLDGRIAIVTGGGAGIGRMACHVLAQAGATVCVADIDPAAAEAVAGEVRGRGFAAEPHALDVTQEGSVVDVFAAVERAHGRIDVLINNAGINVFHNPLDTSDEEWRRCMAVDLEGVWTCCRAVLPTMLKAGGGSIVNIASAHSFRIIPGCFPYPVAKHGLLGLTRALGIEYAARGIRVNAIAPGYIETQIAVDYWNGFPDPEAERQRTYDLHPPKRIGRPEEVGMTAVFLASDEAPFINAACITIDGGRSVLYHD